MFTYALLPSDQNSPQQQQPPQQIQVDRAIANEQVAAQARNINAIARINESAVLLNGMAEIRMALNIPSVAEDDTGTGERPALKPMFDPDQIKTLQASYLSMSEKYHRFVNHVLKNDLKI